MAIDSITSYRRDRIETETLRVARMLADKSKIDEYMQDDCKHMHAESYWEAPKLYHLFMLLLWLRSDGETEGFWARMMTIGKNIITRENDNKKKA